MASFFKNLFRGKAPLSNRNFTLKNNVRYAKNKVDEDLLYAVQNGSVIAAMDALDQGADPNTVSESGSTPLFLVIFNKDKYYGNSKANRANLVDVLLQKGADIHFKKRLAGYDISPLELAALQNDMEVLDVLLKYGDYNSNVGMKNIAKAHNLAIKRNFQLIAEKLYKKKMSLSNASDPGNNNSASDPGSVGGAKRKTRRRKRTQKRRV